MNLISSASGYWRVPGPQMRRLALDAVTEPALAGTMVAGSTVTFTPGVYALAVASRSYTMTAYDAAGVPLVTATNAPLALPASGAWSVSGVETVVNQAGDAYTFPAGTAQVIAVGSPAFFGAPALSGTGTVGSPITAAIPAITGTAPISTAVRWFNREGQILSAQGASYTPTDYDYPGSIRADVVATNAAGETISALSSAIEVVAAVAAAPFPAAYAGTWSCAERMVSPEGFIAYAFDSTPIPAGFDLHLVTLATQTIPDNFLSTPPITPGTSGTRSKPIGETVAPCIYWHRLSDDAVQLAGTKPSFVMQGIPSSPPPTTTEDIQVLSSTASVADIFNAMMNAPSGRVIEIRGKNYAGAMSYTGSGRTWSPPVRLRPYDRGNPPVFKDPGTKFNRLNGFIFDGLVFDNDNTDVDGWPAGTNLNLNESRNFRLVNMLLRGGHIGIEARNVVNAEYIANTLEGCGMDMFRVYSRQLNVLWQYNLLWRTRINLARQGESNRHPDGLQFATITGDVYSDNVRVWDNYIECMQIGSDMHGVFMGTLAIRDGSMAWSTIVPRNFSIRRNFIRTSHAQGIAPEDARDMVVEGNLMRQIPGSDNRGIRNPTVWFLPGRRERVLVENNVTPVVAAGPGVSSTDMTGVTLRNNPVSKTAVPDGWVDLTPGVNVGRYTRGIF